MLSPLPTPIEDDAFASDASTSTTESMRTVRETSSDPGLTPSSNWRTYFQHELELESAGPLETKAYHAYLTPPADLLKGPLFICLHGAGSSAMSFAAFAQAVKAQAPEAGVLAIDFRGHGSDVSNAMDNFGILELSRDIVDAVGCIIDNFGWTRLPLSVLVGHSLGGAVATRIARSGDLGPHVIGLMVLDLVEGSAMEALAHMKTYLASRPASFASVDAAIEWHVRSRTIRNSESAKASVPSLLVRGTTQDDTLKWRTDVRKTEQWWPEWFTGMSKSFLESKVAKALVLAGTDRLDTELMVGQMQGKFQLTVIPEAGHFVQEDVPVKLAELAIEFFRRNDRSSLVLPPKVSDLLAQGKKV